MIQLLSENNEAATCSVAATTREITHDSLEARFIDCVEELESILPEWEELEQSAYFQNPFFESNFLIPAFRHLRQPGTRVLVVEAIPKPASGAPRILCGLMPLTERKRLMFRYLEIWKHDHCSDSTPLLRDGCASQVFEFMLSVLGRQKYAFLSLDTVTANDRFDAMLASLMEKSELTCFQRSSFFRAALKPVENATDYITAHVSKSIRKNSRRLTRRLAEQGTVTFTRSDESSDFEQLAEEFLQIEASGWKGESGTALRCDPNLRNFYLEMIQRSAVAGKAKFVALRLDGRAVAMLSDLQSGELVAAYKTAFDDALSAYSPGTLLELKNIEFMHQSGIEIADSCTAPDNHLINRMWGQRIPFQNLVIGLRRGLPRLAVQSMPILKKLHNQLKRRDRKSEN